MNKSSIYQNIVETYNIIPDSYANINLDFIETDEFNEKKINEILNEKTLMNIIFSKYMSDTSYNEMNKRYIKSLLKSDYVYTYQDMDLVKNTYLYEDNMRLKNNNDFQDSMPHLNKNVVDFDIFNNASKLSLGYLVYLDIIAGIYNKAYELKDDKETIKNLTEIIIPCRYVYENNNLNIYQRGSYNNTLVILRRNSMDKEIYDIEFYQNILDTVFLNALKVDIIKHINYLSGDDISYTDRKYLKNICYFYKYCRLRFCYAIVQAIYLVSVNPTNQINITEKIEKYIKAVVLPVFINFKEIINYQLKDNNYSTSKNVIYNKKAIQTTNKLEKINSKILKNRDKISKNRRINNTISYKTDKNDTILKIASILIIFIAIITLIIILLPVQESSKGFLFIAISLIILVLYIIILSYLRKDEGFTIQDRNADIERMNREIELRRSNIENQQKKESSGNIQLSLSGLTESKKAVDDARRLRIEVEQLIIEDTKRFEAEKAKLESNRNIGATELAQKQAELSTLSDSLKSKQQLLDQRIRTEQTLQANLTSITSQLETVTTKNVNTTDTLNRLQDIQERAIISLNKYLDASKKAEQSQIRYIQAENSYNTAVLLASKNSSVENIKSNTTTVINDLTVENNRLLKEAADKQAKIDQEEEARAQLELQAIELERKNLTEQSLVNNIRNETENMKNVIQQNTQNLQQKENDYKATEEKKNEIERRLAALITLGKDQNNIQVDNNMNIDELIAKLNTELTNLKASNSAANREYSQQRAIELQNLQSTGSINSIIAYAEKLNNQSQQQLDIYNELLRKSQQDLAKYSNEKRDLENKLAILRGNSIADINNAQDMYNRYELETRLRINNLKTEKADLLKEYSEKQIEEENKGREARNIEKIKNDLQKQFDEQIEIYNKLVKDTEYQKELTKYYEMSYIMQDIGILLLNNINDSINGINHDLIVPMLSIEESAFDKYSNELSAYTNQSENDINVRKVHIEQTLASIHLYMSFSLLFPSCLSIYYLLSTIFSVSLGTIFGIIIIINYSISNNSIVRTKSFNKYWTQPNNYVNYL
jgi:hypothetical protein